MTYEEFKEEIKRISDTYDFDLEVMEKGNSIVVGNENLSYALIHKNVPYNMNTILSGLNLQGDSLKYELFVICCELAQTPIPKREQEKKFYIKHKFLHKPTDSGYLNINLSAGYMMLANTVDTNLIKTKFTRSEIEGLKKTYNTNLEEFEIVEVKE